MQKQIKCWLCVLCVSICLLIVWGYSSYAVNIDDPQSGISMSNEEKDEVNPTQPYSINADPYTGLTYTHNHPNDNLGFKYGIDVSYYNGSINWNAVKQDGIQNVMIRVGFRGYGTSGSLNEDVKFRENIEGAINAGLNVGVYFFSQAINQQEAVEEANYVLQKIQGYNINLPVVMDFEYASTGSGLGGRLYNAHLSVENATGVCEAFCRTVEQSGYTAMLYANKSMLENNLDANRLSSQFLIWLANYTTSTSYNGKYDVWQYSSRGQVNGISGYVDCNFWYMESDTVYNGIDYAAVYNYEYYISVHEDIRNAFHGDRQQTLAHFVNSGMAEGRQASEEFNVFTYRNRYSDLRSLFGNDLKSYYMHYITNGKQEGRDGSGIADSIVPITIYEGIDYTAVYDYNYYINTNQDVGERLGGNDYDVLQHFVTCGMSEGRRGNSSFNVYTYKNRYQDLREAFGNDLKNYYIHYITCGQYEGRTGAGESEVIGAQTVYEGIDYSLVYDYEYYINHNADVKAENGDDDFAVLQHFVLNGMREGRQGNLSFNVYVYQKQYDDLRNTFGDDLRSYYLHYITCGFQEGRTGADLSESDACQNIYNGVNYSAVYNKEFYLDNYGDVRAALGEDDYLVLQHFVTAGMSEGRQGSEEFNVYAYRNRYDDLRAAFGESLPDYYVHYITSGKTEGRNGRIQIIMRVENLIELFEEDADILESESEITEIKEEQETENSISSNEISEPSTKANIPPEKEETVENNLQDALQSDNTPVKTTEPETVQQDMIEEEIELEETVQSETEQTVENEQVEIQSGEIEMETEMHEDI